MAAYGDCHYWRCGAIVPCASLAAAVCSKSQAKHGGYVYCLLCLDVVGCHDASLCIAHFGSVTPVIMPKKLLKRKRVQPAAVEALQDLGRLY